jgi:hypothetical protein
MGLLRINGKCFIVSSGLEVWDFRRRMVAAITTIVVWRGGTAGLFGLIMGTS